MRIRLKMVNAEYPAPESRLAIEQAESMVAKKGLHKIIEFNTEYLPMEKAWKFFQALT